MELAPNDSPLSKDFYMLVSVDEKEEKILKIPSFRPQATAGPGLPSARDRPSLLSPSGEVGDLSIKTFPLVSTFVFDAVRSGDADRSLNA